MSFRGWIGNRKFIVYFDDAAFEHENVNRLLINAKPGTGKTDLFIRAIVQGKTEQALLHALAARSVFLDAGVDLPPLALDPPRSAEFFISLIPMKYRENLIGDAEEEYWTRSLPRFGPRKARLIFWTQAIHAWLMFLARPLAGIAGLAWVGKIVDAIISKLLK